MPVEDHTKSCNKCGEEKPLTEFHRRPGGRKGVCRACRCYSARLKYATDHAHRQRLLSYAKQYFKTDAGLETRRRADIRYRMNNRLKRNARQKVYLAVKSGRLPAPNGRLCSKCGTQADQYHHHRGYSREVALDVLPVCRSCHVELDRKYPLCV